MIVPALTGSVTITRDAHGIPTVDAGCEADAWFGLGYAAAADRVWQMEYDRLRACGRWSEAVGATAVEADRLARRLDLERAAQVDLAAMSEPTRAQFEAYAAGVNAWAAQGRLPDEYEATGLAWEPWQAWHSVAAFKIRHVLMGVWQYKLARATVLVREGRDAFEMFSALAQPGMPLIVPAGGEVVADSPEVRALLDQAAEDISRTAVQLGFLAEVEGGSNSWAVAGSRTTTGAPVLCNDSHRALDVPSVYWQVHLRCPEFTASGGTFPGLPGFPHFGHNGSVGWSITHTAADTQDLYVEQFRPAADGSAGLEVRTATGWQPAGVRESTILVRGGDPVTVRCWTTPNGPVVHGDPASGVALSLRWTATQQPCRQFEVLRAMLAATTTTELLDSQAGWIDPVNNLLAADTAGNIGYLMRGEVPLRDRPAAQQIPVPGWEPASQWRGRVAFADQPREENPPGGVIITANNAVVQQQPEWQVGHPVASYLRAVRIHELLAAKERHSFADLAGYQGDVVSVGARQWADQLAGRGPYDGVAEQARAMIADLGGRLDPDQGAPLLYAGFRRALVEVLLSRHVTPPSVAALVTGTLPSGPSLVRRWLTSLTWPTVPGGRCPADELDDEVLAEALVLAWQDTVAVAGEDPQRWRWDEHHVVAGQHTLIPVVGDGWNPPTGAIGGDDDTVQHASYSLPRREPFRMLTCAVYRQVLDFADLSRSGWVIPGGSSAEHTSPHYGDQVPIWQHHQLLPMVPTTAPEEARSAED